MTRHWLATKSEGILCPTSSIGAYADFPYISAYTVTKRAMNNFFRDLSVQTYKDGIRVCLIVPGPTESAIQQNSIGGPQHQVKDPGWKKMSAARCAELATVAIANRLNESWMCVQPWLLATYVYLYFSYELHWLTKQFGLIRFMEESYVKKRN